MYNVPYFTTIAGASAGVGSIEALIKERLTVNAVQDYL